MPGLDRNASERFARETANVGTPVEALHSRLNWTIVRPVRIPGALPSKENHI